jgi:hypothetical protein
MRSGERNKREGNKEYFCLTLLYSVFELTNSAMCIADYTWKQWRLSIAAGLRQQLSSARFLYSNSIHFDIFYLVDNKSLKLDYALN